MSSKPIDKQLHDSELAIDNSLNNQELLQLTAAYGYGEERVNEGKTILERARELTSKQKKEYGDQRQATDNLGEDWGNADNQFKKTRKIANVAFKNNTDARTSLLLNGPRKKSLAGWENQTKTFYTNLLNSPGFLAVMARFGYSQQRLESEYQIIQQAVASNMVQEKEKGDARTSTQERNAALAELDEWVSDYKQVAEVALEEHPEMLLSLGFKVKTGNNRRKGGGEENTPSPEAL